MNNPVETCSTDALISLLDHILHRFHGAMAVAECRRTITFAAASPSSTGAAASAAASASGGGGEQQEGGSDRVSDHAALTATFRLESREAAARRAASDAEAARRARLDPH